MINRQALLSDLQSLLKRLEADLLERSASTDVPEVGETLRAEFERAKKAERTAENYEDWRSGAITQTAAAWVLSCVFVRFLEDNRLIDPPKIAGPNERLQRARDEHELYFRSAPKETDREYLLSVFDALAELPGTRDVFGPHNPLRELPNWLSGDAAGDLLRFFQKISANTGVLVHDFTDPAWDTRFLGDLYQDLSEAIRKKYALLQTPEFVEEFILDRTLEPALDEFGLEPELAAAPQKSLPGMDDRSRLRGRFKMIDPACGSGHFLLGAFRRILNRWQKREPGEKIRVLVQKSLDSIYGVDVNPYAVAIARFRLLLAALNESGEKLTDKVRFEIHVVCGDSLLHAPLRHSKTESIKSLYDEDLSPNSSSDDECEHAYQSEDLPVLKAMLRAGQYHAVVANPPYITPKDRQLNERYRKRFEACHMKYSLAVPFMENLFRLAIEGDFTQRREGAKEEKTLSAFAPLREASGFVGQITANSFMKREFGKKLIETFLPKIDLTHVVDTSGAYIPGCGTPTVILFGRNRKPKAKSLRTVMGIRGEPSTPDDPSQGLVWSAIIEQIDEPGSQSDFVSVGDSERERFHSHPWSIGGGGAAELKELLDGNTKLLGNLVFEIGRTVGPGDDDAWWLGTDSSALRLRLAGFFQVLITGEDVRDFVLNTATVERILYPYDLTQRSPIDEMPMPLNRFLWPNRTLLRHRVMFGKPIEAAGKNWWEYLEHYVDRLRRPFSITYSEVATHNHFVLDRGGKVFNRTAPVIKLPPEATEDDHLALLGLLNCSTSCFWMKQVCHNKGSTVDQHGARQRTAPFEDFFAFNATKVQQLPLPEERPLELARQLDRLAQQLATCSPDAILTQRREDAKVGGNANPLCDLASLRESLSKARERNTEIQGQMIFLQEELDWACYQLYGLTDEPLTYRGEPFPLRFGERAFEILLARSIARGATPTTWFERHGAKHLTAPPEHWPQDYLAIYGKRHDEMQKNANIGLIEQPEYKRRWNTEPWESQLERALRQWLLNRLESYFDFDGRMSLTHKREDAKEAEPLDLRAFAPLREVSLYSCAKLADIARQDPQFMEVGEVYRDDAAFDVERLVDELVQAEHVPLLPVLRYKPSGLRKRSEWEQTWDRQRQEDVIDARTQLPKDHPDYLTADQAKNLKQQEIGDIPVPPKYTSADFLSTGGARYWSLRGKLDVPKERWISFPHCEGPDGTLVIAWAGYDHLQQARAISAYYVEVQERLGGREDPRLIPLLAALIELLPWLNQWHNEVDPEYGVPMGDYFEGFVQEEARGLGMTLGEIKAWEPVKATRGRGKRKRE